MSDSSTDVRRQPPRLLFVCTGNTCRSPMAEVCFRERCMQAGVAAAVASAGIAAVDGLPASAGAQQAAAARGLSLAGFVSRALTPAAVAAADRIYAMTRRHAAHVIEAFPAATDKVAPLLQLLGRDADVADPYGQPPAAYRHCLKTMLPAIDALVRQLRQDGRPHLPRTSARTGEPS